MEYRFGTRRVLKEDGSSCSMKYLNVGDRILVSSYSSDNKLITKYSTVLAIDVYQYFDLKSPVEYLEIHTSLTNLQPLHITAAHSLLVKKQNSTGEKYLFAREIHSGDSIYLVNKENMVEEVHVTEVKQTTSYDAYVPLTYEGTLVVNQALVSCYGTVTHNVGHLIKAPRRWWYKVIYDLLDSNKRDMSSSILHMLENILLSV
ncbi:unnamed protein product [Didymodactylos carnosus]|uniref:Hedgehog protein Hint domain-containing protein n=1 Tax=Didymodactylos carnosus TaxID=1234261 RepID=A0A814EL90_9BILA|nr:unnamed protein product [Didymodactylos carnosus]CAF3746713.1 unnamed protein product [Didymodactylos carnosus]